jgi:hypothetical protein
MVAWMLGAFAGPSALAGLAICLCRRRRRHRRLTRDQIAGSGVLAGPERHENPNRPTLDQQRPGRLPAPGAAAMASLPASPTMNLQAWVVPPGRVPAATSRAVWPPPVRAMPVSATLATNEVAAARRARGQSVLPLAFGEAGFPVRPVLRGALSAAAGANGYGPVAGQEVVRSAAAAETGRIGSVVVTLPNNPTDRVPRPATVRALCQVAAAHQLIIICDEIYRALVHDPATPILSPAQVAPRHTVVTTGLSKSLALGGWRIGAARLPGGPLGDWLRRALIGADNEIWSAPAAPVQHSAAPAFTEPAEITERIEGEPHGAKQITASNPRFLAAQAACGHLVPNGGQETVAQIQAYLRDAVRFAGCMRTHGLPNWPDPTNDGARIRFFLPASIDMGSHQVAVAADRCQSLLHVNLETNGMG